MPRPQTSTENCTWHNFNVIPTYKALLRAVGQLPVGHLGVRLHEPAGRSEEIAFADPAPYNTDATDRRHRPRRQLVDALLQRQHLRVRHPPRRDSWRMNLAHDATRRRRPHLPRNTSTLSNPQTQIGAFAQDLDGPTITSHHRRASGYKQGSTVPANFDCADNDSGVESCIGTVADGTSITRASATRRSRSPRRTRPATSPPRRRVHGQQHRLPVQRWRDRPGHAGPDAAARRPRSARSRRASRGVHHDAPRTSSRRPATRR